MGVREFFTFVEATYDAQRRAEGKGDTWAASENDPGWQAMRAKRDRARGR